MWHVGLAALPHLGALHGVVGALRGLFRHRASRLHRIAAVHPAQMSRHGVPHLRHLPVGARRGHLLDQLQHRRQRILRRRRDRLRGIEGHRGHRLRHPRGDGAERQEPYRSAANAKEEVNQTNEKIPEPSYPSSTQVVPK